MKWINVALFDEINYATPSKNFVIARKRSAGLWVSGSLGALGRGFESCRPDQL